VKAMDSASERKSNDCRVAIAAMPTDRPNAGAEPESSTSITAQSSSSNLRRERQLPGVIRSVFKRRNFVRRRMNIRHAGARLIWRQHH
jgi:hypothetical protein